MKLIVSDIRGVDKLSLHTKKLIAAAQQGMKFGVSEAAFIVQEEAKALVAVDTGYLQANIHGELTESTETRIVITVTPAFTEPNAWGLEPAYARRIEYGFQGADSLGRIFNQAAQPYMRPAFDGKQQEAREAIKRSILDELAAAR